MRPILLALATLMLLPAPARAADDAAPLEANTSILPVTRGALPTTEDIIPGDPSKEQVEEANHIYADCAGNARESQYYDCNCISVTFLQQRMLDQRDEHDRLTPAPFLLETARKKCPNATGIAGMAYQRCLSFAPRMRDDYEAFCTCYATDYAKRFAYNPTTSLKMNQWMMEASMNQCNVGQPVIDRMIRNQRIEQMKKDGTYEQMFPSAKTLPKPTGPQPLPQSKTLTPSQRLTNQMFQPDNGPQRTEPSPASP